MSSPCTDCPHNDGSLPENPATIHCAIWSVSKERPIHWMDVRNCIHATHRTRPVFETDRLFKTRR